MRFFASLFIAMTGLVSVFAASSAFADQPALEPGMYRIMFNSTTNAKADPPQDIKQCLGEELKDLVGYFAPRLEDVEAKCERTRQPSKDREVLYRMQCSGAGITIDALTGATIENSRHFTITMRVQTRTKQESALVIGKGEGHLIGACPGK